MASDFLAGTARQQTMPTWLLVVIVLVAGALADRIPRVRNGRARQRWVFAGLAGGIAGAIAWCVGYFFFNVEVWIDFPVAAARAHKDSATVTVRWTPPSPRSA